MDNRRLARVFSEIGDLLDIKGENPFRIRSYRIAAETLENLGEDVAARVRRGEPLKGIPGIGEGIAGKIQEIVSTGSCVYHRELLAEVPGGLLDLLQVPGLGPKGVALVWRQLGVGGASDLLAAIDDGRFRTLPGMKEKKEARIRKGLEERLARPASRFLISQVAAAAEGLIGYLREHGATRVEPCGSFRRRRETIGDLDLVVLGNAAALSDAFVTHPDVKEVLGHGHAKSSVVLASGLQVDLRPMPEESLGAALQYFTGSKAHNVATRERAVKRGLKLNEYGLYRIDGGERVAGATEEEIYAALGLSWVPPELREDRGEVEAAERGQLPVLVELSDLKGDLHSHTVESDGRDELSSMAEAARARGLHYLAITEHSQAQLSPTRGRGLDEKRCLEHIARCRAQSERMGGFRVLAGIEVDILADGRLDMADDVLAQLDVVVASLHSALDQERGAMTERLLRAFENPHIDIWGHPLARLIGEREPIAVDFDAVLAVAVKAGIALEVNGSPERLDLPDGLIRTAQKAGARFVISTDAHSVAQLDQLRWGVSQARRGWLTAAEVLNTRHVDGLLGALR
jgi:DNA polymerase (family 10)